VRKQRAGISEAAARLRLREGRAAVQPRAADH